MNTIDIKMIDAEGNSHYITQDQWGNWSNAEVGYHIRNGERLRSQAVRDGSRNLKKWISNMTHRVFSAPGHTRHA
jgi:hypothetical protein